MPNKEAFRAVHLNRLVLAGLVRVDRVALRQVTESSH